MIQGPELMADAALKLPVAERSVSSAGAVAEREHDHEHDHEESGCVCLNCSGKGACGRPR